VLRLNLADIFQVEAQRIVEIRLRQTQGSKAPYPEYANRTVAFARDILGVEPWGKQRDILDETDKWDLVAVRSAVGVGKSFSAAIKVLMWLNVYDDSKVVTTAGTFHQVEGLLWREIRTLFSRSKRPLAGRMLSTEYTISPSHFAVGKSTDEADHFRGVHAPGGVLCVIDEANGVPDEIHDACLDNMTGRNCKLLQIGNPVRRSGRFHEAFSNKRWHCFAISAFDVPDPPPAAGMTTRESIERRRELLGPSYESHPMWQSNILGNFPDEGDRALFPMSWLEAAADIKPPSGGAHLGVDIARFGSDSCVAAALFDGRMRGLHEWNKTDTMTSAATIMRLADEWGIPGANIHVDVSGVGGGVVDRLREAGRPVDAVDFGAAAQGDWDHLIGRTMRFRNRRCELHWVAHRLIEERMLSVPARYTRTWADLMALEWDYSANEIMTMPSKEEVRSRIGRSPDHSDALVIALSRANPFGAGYRVLSGSIRGRPSVNLARRNGTH